MNLKYMYSQKSRFLHLITRENYNLFRINKKNGEKALYYFFLFYNAIIALR